MNKGVLMPLKGPWGNQKILKFSAAETVCGNPKSKVTMGGVKSF